MKTFERIAKNSIHILSRRDTLALVEEIIKACDGNKTKACELIGIERKTYYNWKENVKLIKPDCKEKVLKTALMLNPIDTLDKLTAKSFNNSRNLLYLTLSAIYEEILNSDNNIDKERLIDKFVEILKKYNVSPVERLNVEINDMLADIKDECPWYDFEQKFKCFTPLYDLNNFLIDLNNFLIVKPADDEETRPFNIYHISTEELSKTDEELPKTDMLEKEWNVVSNA